MRRIAMLLLGAMLLSGHVARAADTVVPTADAAAIQSVIEQQMAAFRRDDAAAAFGFASPGIQAQFGSDPQTFLSMVQHAYQPVYRPRSTVFGATETQDGQVVQHVHVVGPDGAATEALYYMEHEPDGTWRIAGCVLTASTSVGA